MGEARLAEAMPPEGALHGISGAIKDLVGGEGGCARPGGRRS